MQKKKGISLIVLVITIIVMIVLAGAIILSLNNAGIINRSNEAVFKQNVKNYQSELSLYLAEQLSANSKFDVKTVKATSLSTPSIKDMISSMSDVDLTKFDVYQGTLRYIGSNDQEKVWCKNQNIEVLVSSEEKYNTTYSSEVANAQKYGEVDINGKFSMKVDYTEIEGINTIAVPYGTTSIQDYTFENHEWLKKIVVPETMTVISSAAFCKCYNLQKVEILGEITSIESYAFSETAIYSLKLPHTLKNIGEFAFGMSGISNIDISSVTNIEKQAFMSCENLRNIKWPEGVTVMEESMFAYSGLESIVIPETVTEIKNYAFASTSLATINYMGTKSQWEAITIGTKGNEVLSTATINYEYAG